MSWVYNRSLFASRLKQLMQEYKDSTYSLAGFLHMNASSISKYTTEAAVPNIAVLEKIAQHYDVNPLWLMGTEGSVRELPIQEKSRKETAKETVVDNLLDRLIENGIIKNPDNIDKETADMIINAIKIDLRLRMKK